MVLIRIVLCCLLLMLPSLTYARIVFKSYRDINRSLYVMDDDGSNGQRLTDSVFWPVWSPDGKQIAFSKNPPRAPNWPQKFAIYIINSDGSNEHRLTEDDTKEWICSWSPDGRYIAFKSERSGQSQIWTINLRTKAIKQLTRTDGLTTAPSWSPDGKYIAYRDDSPHGQFTVYVMHANGDRQRELIKGDLLRMRSFPRWSPDSKSVVYIEDTLAEDGGQIVRVSRKAVIHNINTDKRQIVDIPDDWHVHSACFMGPKEMLISAKNKNVDQSKYDIYRYHLVTGEIVDLTNNPNVHDLAMDWISNDVLPVTPKGKKRVVWGTIKK